LKDYTELIPLEVINLRYFIMNNIKCEVKETYLHSAIPSFYTNHMTIFPNLGESGERIEDQLIKFHCCVCNKDIEISEITQHCINHLDI